MPPISGRVDGNLTVRDLGAGTSWCATLLDLDVLYDFTGSDGRMHCVALTEPKAQFVLRLAGPAANSGEPFSGLHAGLDRLHFLVNRRDS
jgi:hypothetical protein